MTKTKSVLIRITLVLVIAGMFFAIVNMHMKMNKQAAQIADLNENLSVLRLHNEQLTIWNNSPIDREYIIRIAKEQGFRMPDEVLFYNDLAK